MPWSRELYWLIVIAEQARKAVEAWQNDHSLNADMLSLENQLRQLDTKVAEPIALKFTCVNCGEDVYIDTATHGIHECSRRLLPAEKSWGANDRERAASRAASASPGIDADALRSPVAPSIISRGAWLRWAYENLSEREYLLMLRAVRADQQATA